MQLNFLADAKQACLRLAGTVVAAGALLSTAPALAEADQAAQASTQATNDLAQQTKASAASASTADATANATTAKTEAQTSNKSATQGELKSKPAAEDSLLSQFNKLPKSRITKMREAYQKAEKAFKSGNSTLGRKIQREQLKGYPLNLWLDYYYLAYNMNVSKFNDVMKFIKANEQSELTNLLTNRYATFLSSRRDYKRLSQLIGPKEIDETKITDLSFAEKSSLCRFYEANWPLNKVDEDAVRFATRLYLDLSRRPKVCTAFMDLFEEKGYLTDKLILKRFEQAYVRSSYTETTQDLAKSLEGTQFKDRVLAQMKLYEEPKTLFDLKNDEQSHRVAVLAFRRYANLSPRAARADFNKFKKQFEPSDVELLDIYRTFATGFLGRSFSESDVRWVDENLPVLAWTNDLKEQRLRRAIFFAQWENVYMLIDFLPKDVRSEINWQYWKARAAKELGYTKEANELMAKVAQDRSFFGFYAAQELGLDYQYHYNKLSPDYNFPADIANNKAALRFFELYAMDDSNAIYEWREISKRSPQHEAMVMAQWALQNGNVRYAIDYVISSKHWDALDYRFPIAYADSYKAASEVSKVSLSFLYGVSRQESMLNPTIKSWAGAVGLMQLMPNTAKQIARKEKWKFEGVGSLTDPETNIKYGSTYLNWMLSRFDNNRILAAAAYNAGPNRIPRWRSGDGLTRDPAMFVECIPFDETRKYVQNVLLYDSIYNYLITGEVKPFLNQNEFTYAY